MKNFSRKQKVIELRGRITAFQMDEDEYLQEAWERFKDLLRRCPQHGFADWQQIHLFCNGITPHWRTMLDAAAGTSLLNKTPDEAIPLIESMAENRTKWNTGKITPPRRAVHAVETKPEITLGADRKSTRLNSSH